VRACVCVDVVDVRAVRSDTARRILRGVLQRQMTLFRQPFKRTNRQLDDNIMFREQLLCELLAAMSFRACLVTKGQDVAVAALRLWNVADSLRAAPRRTEGAAVRSLLSNRDYHIEFGADLTTHVKHAVMALRGPGLGPADGIIHALLGHVRRRSM
jgi:hypothetical protein